MINVQRPNLHILLHYWRKHIIHRKQLGLPWRLLELVPRKRDLQFLSSISNVPYNLYSLYNQQTARDGTSHWTPIPMDMAWTLCKQWLPYRQPSSLLLRRICRSSVNSAGRSSSISRGKPTQVLVFNRYTRYHIARCYHRGWGSSTSCVPNKTKDTRIRFLLDVVLLFWYQIKQEHRVGWCQLTCETLLMLSRELDCSSDLRISKTATDPRYASLLDRSSSMLAEKCSGCNRRGKY